MSLYISRVILNRLKHGLQRGSNKSIKKSLTTRNAIDTSKAPENRQNVDPEHIKKDVFNPNLRNIYPEFLPDPNPEFRNSLREKLERIDMLQRRSQISIPEFYVGSILAVTISEPHAPDKTTRFVGLCIQRKGCGLRAQFTLRNVVDHQGVEVAYDLYDPLIQTIEILKLEKRLDKELLFLRDCPLEYSTFPFDMKPVILPPGAPVPINDIKVPLRPLPWTQKWETKNLKGVTGAVAGINRMKRAAANQKPWEKYDIMKQYRETIPEEDQKAIFGEIYATLVEQDVIHSERNRKAMLNEAKKK
ncbi:large ribosomal subunit protein bL19m [Prorops nasuta]|uniref:large ribosomal subunit protein bL19m n=1 Tax=Prorops nasuta TaxID=863751 RepID=UPI0034CD583D